MARLEQVGSGAAATKVADAGVDDDRFVSPITSQEGFGRCGPGTGWSALGDVYTGQCANHDYAVRLAKLTGSSDVMAHVKALPKLPAAIGSYLNTKVI